MIVFFFDSRDNEDDAGLETENEEEIKDNSGGRQVAVEEEIDHGADLNEEVIRGVTTGKNKTVKKNQPATKRRKKNDTTRSWTDEEVDVLIELWSQHDNLFNTKDRKYFNRDLRQKSLESIEKGLKDSDIEATTQQITKKLTDLKNYYGGQRRMIEGSKTSGAGTDDVYVSVWKFYEKLDFLSDAFTPRKTKSNAAEEVDETPYSNAKPPSAKSVKKSALAQQNELQKVMSTAATALETVITKNSQAAPKVESADDTFGKLLVDQLKLIPECDLKDELKITLQQIVLKCKRQAKTTQPNVYMEQPTTYTPMNPVFNSSFIRPQSPQSPLTALSSPNGSYSGSYTSTGSGY